MFETIKGEYGDSMVWRGRPEPVRPDPKLDRISLSAYLTVTGWSVEALDYAIATYAHPKPDGRTVTPEHTAEPFYSRAAIRVWRERIVTDLRALGFSIKK